MMKHITVYANLKIYNLEKNEKNEKKPVLVTDKNQLGSGAGLVSGRSGFALCSRAEVKVAIGPQVEHKLEGIFGEAPGMLTPNVYQSMSKRADRA